MAIPFEIDTINVNKKNQKKMNSELFDKNSGGLNRKKTELAKMIKDGFNHRKNLCPPVLSIKLPKIGSVKASTSLMIISIIPVTNIVWPNPA